MRQLWKGTVLTMEDVMPECSGILVKDGRIERVGLFEELRREFPDVQVENRNGKTILPGFIDGHSHLTAAAYGTLLFNAKPSPQGNCNSVQDLIREGRRFLESNKDKMETGQWLMGMGYDNMGYPNERHPAKWDLDQISADIPVAVTHVSGHLCAVNSKGMELLGYDREDCVIPAGGEVEPSGLLKETAFASPEVMKRMKGPNDSQLLDAIGLAAEMYASYGITTMQDAKLGMAEYQLLNQAGRQGRMKGDVACYLEPEAAERLLPKREPAQNRYEDHCRLAGVKIFLDGSPQGKTAWLSEPYYVVPEGKAAAYSGFPLMKDGEVLQVFTECINNHWQVNVHANGDEAIEQMIRCYAKAVEDTGCKEDLRPVIIHCQTVRKDQLERMAKLGILASFFHDHVYYWGDYHYESVLGPERAERISPLGWALEYGVPFTQHQDTPVILPDVMLAVHNAVNRKTMKGRVLGAEQRINIMDALKACTINGAYQIFEEHDKGSIAPGKLADFTILEENPLDVPNKMLKNIQINTVVKAGQIIWDKYYHLDKKN